MAPYLAPYFVVYIFLYPCTIFSRVAYKLSCFNTIQAYDNRLIAWASEVIQLMSDSIILCELDPEKMNGSEFFDLRNQTRSKYMELIDRGRWFYTNEKGNEYGQWKEGAYRGIAPRVISYIKDALGYIEKLSYTKKAYTPYDKYLRDEIVACKRLFTSAIQVHISVNKTKKHLDTLRRKS